MRGKVVTFGDGSRKTIAHVTSLAWKRSVPPAVAGGSLMADPPATAGGTDLFSLRLSAFAGYCDR